jgi:tape measure domain-containing protein
MAQNIVFKISADTSNFDAGMKKTGVEVDAVNKKTKQATAEVGQFQKALGNIGGMVAGAFAVSSLIAFGKEVAKTRAEIESLTTRIADIKGGQEQGDKAMAELRKTANELGIEFKELASNYASFVGGAKASGVEISKAEKIFKSMTIAIKGSGANAETAKRAFTALTQMIGKGKIQAEELRGQLGEAMPAAFGIMAKSLGVTTQELDKMMASGQLLASEVLPKFAQEMENAYGANAQEMATQLNAKTAILENSFTALYETIGNTGFAEVSLNILIGLVQQLNDDLERAVLGIANYTIEQEQKRITPAIEKAVEQRIEAYKKEGKTAREIIGELVPIYQVSSRKQAELLTQLEAEKEKMALSTNEAERARLNRNVEELAKAYGTQKSITSAYYSAVIAMDSEYKDVKDKGASEMTDAELKRLEKEKSAREKAQKDIKDWLTEQAKIHLETRSGLVGPQQTREQANMGMGIDERTKKEMQSQFEEAQTNLEHAHKMGEKTEEQYLRAKLALYEKYGQDKRKVEEEIYAFEQGFAKERTKEVWTEAQSRVYATDKTLETLNMLNNAYTQSQTNQLQKQLEQGVISQEQYEQSLRKIKRRQAVIDKAGALFNIAINTAQGVSSAAGSVLGLPLAPVIGALGAIQAGIVLATPIPYNKGTKKVPMVRGAVRGKDSVHAILTPNERVVPEDINTQPGYSALMDLAHDRKISDKEAGFIAKLATGGVYAGQQSSGDIDYNQLGKSIAKYIPHTDVRIDHNGIAVITDRSHANMNRLKTRL